MKKAIIYPIKTLCWLILFALMYSQCSAQIPVQSDSTGIFITQEGIRYYAKTAPKTWSSPKDNGDGTATWKNEIYPIQIGPQGGRFIVPDPATGKKKYLERVA